MTEYLQPKWQFWIDRGGTFTDVIGHRSDGQLVVHKLLSEDKVHYADAAIQGIRDVLQLKVDQALPLHSISVVKMGTTVATNALLERTGERTALFVNAGFADALRIAYQNRPDIFARHIVLPELLYEKVIELSCRVDAHGNILTPLDHVTARGAFERAYREGFRSCAIVFMHGYSHPEHERECMSIARAVGFTQISVSHQVSPLIKFVTRGDTTVADAYLSPILNRYLEGLKKDLGDTPVFFMQSNGGLIASSQFRGKDSLLSGPAGGVVGAVRVACMAGIQKLVGFDMGGTSTDVFHFEGEYERQMESQISGITIRVPMMSITSVASGGGSIVSFAYGRFQVGPQSAGAMPGPASYRNGGPLTITDCNVLLGRIQPEFFPSLFGKDGREPLDRVVVSSKFGALATAVQDELREVDPALASRYSAREKIAEGFVMVAVQKMAQAIKKVSIEKGHDITSHALVSFGGAGGQHACLVAESLGITTVLIHPVAGVLSALGMGLADTSCIRQLSVQAGLESLRAIDVEQLFQSLIADCTAELSNQGCNSEQIKILRKLMVHYEGADSTLLVEYRDLSSVRDSFESAHKKRYGFFIAQKELVIEALLVEALSSTDHEQLTIDLSTARSLVSTTNALSKSINNSSDSENASVSVPNKVSLYSRGEWHEVSVYTDKTLKNEVEVKGPAIISESTSTTIVESGWTARRDIHGALIMRREKQIGNTPPGAFVCANTEDKSNSSMNADPVLLELFNNMFMSIAEEMGTTLQQTSHSVNIKERLDFSCAIFDSEGELIANAPHIPVHLGSMGESVQVIIETRKESMRPGDVFILNNPYHGGTHLPDITVITPVFAETLGVLNSEHSRKALFYTAARGHHSDIGGMTPGSMPPDSTHIDQEGILIDNFQLVANGQFLETEIRALLSSGSFPARNIKRNISDLKAQIAANNQGVNGLASLVAKYGITTVQDYMRFIRVNAEASVRRAIGKLHDGQFVYQMDDGKQIAVSVRIDHSNNSALIDFEGTSLQAGNNFNAPISVCKAAVLYVFRTLIEDNIPLNAGCMTPLTIAVPSGSMLNPRYPAAVVAGNVETSQCIVDALYGALNVMSASQGTMNNFTFGNAHHQYYETICGGSGAGPSFNGTDAVQTHMTNSRLTDPEVLEWRFPVMVESFAIRPESGGTGQFAGGNGVIRRIKFSESMTASILSGRRVVPPFGLNGGNPGQTGRNYVQRADGTKIELSGTESLEINSGDIFVVETPGGGGWGAKLS